MLTIRNTRQLFLDSTLIARSTAALRMHSPSPRELVYIFNSPEDGNGAGSYLTLLHDGPNYLLYYLSGDMYDSSFKRSARVLTSLDGIRWDRPNLRNGTNIVFDPADYNHGIDNFIPFIDQNPACKPDERFKAFSGLGWNNLHAYSSPDGFHWSPMFDNKPLAMEGAFDSSNLCFWDTVRGRYTAYIRNFHDIPDGDVNRGIRDIRVSYSDDFEHWTEPKLLDYGSGDDIPLYVSAAQPYFRAPEYFVAFPVRYVEHPAWSPAFDQLSNPDHRKYRISLHPRYGLAVTDCLFMSTRDGEHWQKSDEAFLRPGPVCDKSWVYGDCYLSVGMAATPSDRPGAPDEISLYACENHWNGPKQIRRYTLRADGFMSLHAGGAQTFTETATLTFEGSTLELNVSTSAVGSVRVELADAHGRVYEGFSFNDCDDIFTDRLDYRVTWNGSADVSKLAGKPVRMRFVMREADLYSFRFV